MGRSKGRAGRQWRRVRKRILEQSNICWWCGQPIDMELTRRDPNHDDAASVDHIVPLAHGGDPLDPSGLRPAHRGCNSRRGARVDAQPSLRSRVW